MFKNNLRKFMDENGCSEDYIAHRIGSSQPTVHRMIMGETLPNLEKAIRIARFFDKKFEEIWPDLPLYR